MIYCQFQMLIIDYLLLALWPNCWDTIMDIINENLQWEMDNLYKKLNGKLDRLQTKIYTPRPSPRVNKLHLFHAPST